jgi:hypothetical protein
MSEQAPEELREVHARFDRLFAKYSPADTNRTRSLISRISTAARCEARAVAERLVAIGELFGDRLREFGEAKEWAVDTTDVVAAEVAAALRISKGMALSYLGYARAMRERLPQVGAVFRNGDIDFHTFKTLVFRTDLITDDDVLAGVDAELAIVVPRWSSMSRGQLAGAVDKIVARADRDAVRKRRNAASERGVWISDRPDGLSEISGTVFTTTAHVLDKKLMALIATVCVEDGRTADQRRADATLTLAAGGDRMACQCGRSDCPAGAKPPAGPIVIHVIAEQATVEGRSDAPGSYVGADGLIPPELITELAKNAKLRPLVHPGDAPPEPGYVPSQALADFVRSRDLTCRAPGCDVPASECDLDHTIPFGRNGLTHASDLKCLCRKDHLLKTFWGWRDEQLPDGTVIWTLPGAQRYVTTPGSALLFPALCVPTGPLPTPTAPSTEPSGDRTAMMPKRRRTRAENRAAYIARERGRHRRDRTDQIAAYHLDFRRRSSLDAQDRSPPPF